MPEQVTTRPDAEGEIEVSAPAERVYALVSDLDALADAAREFAEFQWLDGATASVPGARFKGVNNRGGRRWSTTCTITDAEPGRRFAFDVTALGRVPVARWEYTIEPTADGCRVFERTWARYPAWLRILGGLTTGVWDRAEANRVSIAATLRELKDRAEKETATTSE